MAAVADDHIGVLLVEDDDEDYLLTQDLLSNLEGIHYDVDRVSNYQSALDASRKRTYDICLVDYRLGPDDGIDLVRKLIEGDPDIPVIVLTGQGDRDVDVQAAKAGAADYLVKGEISATLLERTIRYAIQTRAARQALRESEEGRRHAQRIEAVGQLAGGVAHDFNNMMSAVIGFAELALMRLDVSDDPVRRYVEEIKRAGERAADLTSQLLAFSRKQVLQTRVFNVNEVIGDVETLLRRLIDDNVELITVLDPALGAVEADPGQVEQVIMNLTINARDAMPSGGKLTIETTNVALDEGYASRYIDIEPGEYVLLSVTDTGVGMDASTIERIFEPFFTTKDVGGGTGLGLSTVFGIVKQSGGDVGVYSELGRGSTFKVFLPRVDAAVDRIEFPVEDSTAPSGSETILLVDDEELVRSFEREVLLECGYTVLEARGPHHALDLSRDHPGAIHLLLTDVVMPGLSGRDLSAQVTKDRPEIRTLYTSGYPAGAIVRHGVLDHGIAFLPKPLSRVALAHKVREVLDASS
jgi:two-component system, cell cycle sensor histidine kinase and response regulator CckA